MKTRKRYDARYKADLRACTANDPFCDCNKIGILHEANQQYFDSIRKKEHYRCDLCATATTHTGVVLTHCHTCKVEIDWDKEMKRLLGVAFGKSE